MAFVFDITRKERKIVKGRPAKLITVVAILFTVLFLFSVLTVESHQHAKGTINSKAPTCIEGTVELACDGLHTPAFDVSDMVGYLSVSRTVFYDGRSAVSSILYRGPPVASS